MFRVALLQYPIIWADKQANLKAAVRRIRRLKGKADVALLPEMFSTGFCTDQPELAEPIDGTTLNTLQRVADETGVAICSSFICEDYAATHLNEQEQEQRVLYNRGFFLRPDDSPQFADKAHLYAHGGEDKFFTAGNERTVFEYKGVKMRLLICYDLRFPVWARNTTGWDYDILLVAANWPEVRIQYWDALIAARGTENQCYICAVNPVGDDGLGLHYNGHSIAYDTHLKPLARFADNAQGTKIAELDIERLHHFRNALPLWHDTDRFKFV